MANFGIAYAATQDSIPPAELGAWAEAHGFESLWLGEHSHIPTSRKTPFQTGDEVPEYYKQLFDPFIALTAAAAITSKLKLGTSVCLVAEHDAINLAKTVATLDRVSNGRFLLGIGAGWNAEEMADHGVEFEERWRVVRERVLAMKEIWTKEVAEYHGKFVNFGPMWSWPKPLRAGGPPVLMGGWSKSGAQADRRVLQRLASLGRGIHWRRRLPRFGGRNQSHQDRSRGARQIDGRVRVHCTYSLRSGAGRRTRSSYPGAFETRI